MAGRLIIAGSGIRAVGQLTLETVAWIEAADVVCHVLADPLTERWVRDHARATEDLSTLHDPVRPRLHSYATMAARLVDHARRGRTVVGLFYGHPGVFTSPSHWAVELARAEGIDARMLPGVSAEDCLFADLGVDPGDGAFEAFEATELLLSDRQPSADAHCVIWQVGVVAAQRLDTGSGAAVLTSHLCKIYPADHLVTHYRAPQTPVGRPVCQQVPMAALASLPMSVTSTLYIPPVKRRPISVAAVTRLDDGSSPDVERPPRSFAEVAALVGEHGDAATPLPTPEWHQGLPAQPSRLEALLTALQDPATRSAYEAQPGLYLGAAGLDTIEMWAMLVADEDWIAACIRHGSGPAAAVAVGVAATEEEARGFQIAADGRLVRRKTRQPPQSG